MKFVWCKIMSEYHNFGENDLTNQILAAIYARALLDNVEDGELETVEPINNVVDFKADESFDKYPLCLECMGENKGTANDLCKILNNPFEIICKKCGSEKLCRLVDIVCEAEDERLKRLSQNIISDDFVDHLQNATFIR